MSELTNVTKFPRIFILLLLVSFPASGTVLFTPALPIIANYFGVDTGTAQLTVTFYLIGFALGQLPYGPLANRIGRIPTLRAGLILAGIASAFCAIAGVMHLFPLLVISRFFMGVGASAGLKIVFTMVGDLHVPPQSTKIFSYTVLAYAIMPGIATSIGGLLTETFDWQSCFYFLTIYSLALLMLTYFLPETRKPENFQLLHYKTIFDGYLAKFKNHKLVLSALILGLRTSFIYVFATKAPFIGKQIGLRPDQFGYLSLIPPVGMIIGTIIAANIAGRFKEIYIILLGEGIAFAGLLYMLAAFFIQDVTILSLFLPMFIIDIGLSLIYANASSIGMSHAKNISNGAAMMNFINLGLSVAMVFLIGKINPDNPLAMPVLFGALLIAMVLVWTRLQKRLN